MRKRKHSSKPFLLTRRGFLKAAGALSSAYWLGPKLMIGGKVYAQTNPTLDPGAVPKYVTPLLIPPVMPQAGKAVSTGGKNADYYEISVRQFQEQILPAPLNRLGLWRRGWPGRVSARELP